MLRKLYIEPTTKCNLNCKMCFRHTWFDEPICDLSLEDYRHVLATMPRSVETVFFGGMGEPLFHKDILEMIRLAAQTGAEVELLTNGTLLTETMIHGILDAGLTRLWISIDDLETEKQEKNAGHNQSGQILDNIRTFNRIRQAKHSTTSLGITFVAMKSNVHQLALLPFFLNQYMIDEANVSNISPTDEGSREEMLYTNLVNTHTGGAKGSVLPSIKMPFFDIGIPEVASGITEMMKKRYFALYFNDEPVIRKDAYCKFVREGMAFVRSDGNVSPCMPLLHNNYTYLNSTRRKIYHCSFGNVKQQSLSDIWNSGDYRAFRRKFEEFDFAPCITCGHCELVEDNKMDCIGNDHPACGGCLWAEGVLSCP